ncbi:unnamed protein product [Ixodes hexagonus]
MINRVQEVLESSREGIMAGVLLSTLPEVHSASRVPGALCPSDVGVVQPHEEPCNKGDVDESTVKITKFVVGTQYLYGESQMTLNVHTLLHIRKSVLLHGPLWTLSCFEFESSMGLLLKLVSSANGIPLQILSCIFFRDNFRQLQSMASEEVRQLCSHKARKRKTGVELLGKPRAAPEDIRALLQEDLGSVHSIQEYSRMHMGGCAVHSEQHKTPFKRDSTAVKVGDEYAKIERILCVQRADGAEGVFALSYVYEIESVESVDHLKLPQKTSSRRFHPLTETVSMHAFENG